MKLITLGVAAALAVGSIGLACAGPTNLITNGNFSTTTAPYGQTPTQFGTGSLNGFTATQFISGWSGNDGYEIWYNNSTDAVGVQAHSEWGFGGANTGKEMLYGTGGANGTIPAPPGGTFVGMDGDACATGSSTGLADCNAPAPGTNGIQGSISQSVTLTKGKTYTLSFYWAAGQLQSRTGNTLSSFGVTVGSQALNALTSAALNGDGSNDGTWPVYENYLSNPSDSFTGWKLQTYTFTADAGGSQLLSFLSLGAPGGLPPFALLADVSLTAVPEPADLGIMGLGLAVIGGLFVFERRRRKERREAEA